MAILLYGLNHQSAPIALRERLVIADAELPATLLKLASAAGIEEAFLLSTCNRTEILVSGEPGCASSLAPFLVQVGGGIGREELERHAYLHVDGAAVRHLFRVTSSLDSMVVGEPQILGQVKTAYVLGRSTGTIRSVLEGLLQRAFAVAKQVRSSTGIGRAPVSIAHAAATRAREIFGDLGGHAVVVVGAGKMARLAAQHVTAGGVGSLTVVNRSWQGADELARELHGTSVAWERLFDVLEGADVVIVSTAAPHHVIDLEEAQRLARARRGRPIFLLDIAVPRNVDPRVNALENVYLYDLDDLRAVAEAGREERRREAEQAEAIVEQEAELYLDWARGLQASPTIVELRARLHDLGEAEMARFRGRLGPLSEEQSRVLEEFRIALLNKILHHPTLALKRAGSRPEGGGAIALLREAFGLDAEEPGDEGKGSGRGA
ncbi:MAG TPA: glutamyl-tRNA reductase [Candidatus Polarisedimenticolia bacterium]|nr:glutamyl-tRNA reductase [Candidatus Polarisedimenticolia bacterium]